jgi:peptidoglycan-associated lipoprotein
MKTKLLGLIVLVFAMGLALGGCGCFYQQVAGEKAPPPPPVAQVLPPEAKAPVPVQPLPPPPPPPDARPDARPAAVAGGLNDIFFDFDKYAIRAGDAEILKKDLDWFKMNPGKKVRIEGHCDERGTVEYNLVLGQKRADSTKGYLVNLGVDGKMLETVSYGKERPFEPAHNEAAWAKNRRAHFLPVQ